MSSGPRSRSAVGTLTEYGLLTTPLRRGTDRVEILARWVGVSAFVVSLMVGAATAGTTQQRLSAAAEAHRAESYRTTAVLREDATSGATPVYAHATANRARATWTTQVGTHAEGRIDVPATAQRGDRVPLVLDAGGRPTAPTPSAFEIDTVSAVVGLQTPALTLLGCWLWLALVRRILDGPRARYWESAWRAFDRSGSAPQP